MISWLAAQIIPLTLLTLILMMSHKFVISRLGAIGQYSLWAVLPLTLILSFIEFPKVEAITNGTMNHYVVNGQTQIQTLMTNNWLLWGWFIGIAVFTLIIFTLGYKARVDNSLKRLEDYSLAHPLPKTLALCSSEQINSPLICGFIHPKLVVPTDFFNQYTFEEQSLILQHEVCHFERRDLYANAAALCLLIMFWFNPVIWLGYFRFRKDQELACDSQVLGSKDKSSKLIYSRALLKCAQSNGQFSFAQLQYGDKETMTERILQIKTMRPVSKLITVTALTLGLLASISLSYAGNDGTNVNSKVDSKKSEMNQNKRKTPHPVMRVEPKYPIEAAKNRITGYVQLAFDISKTGEVSNINVVESNPIGIFDKVAVTALSQWQYQASKHGAEQATVQLDFMMDEPKKNIEHIKVTP